MSVLDLEWVAIFDEIYKTSNVTLAAERLNIAQGAASKALAKLRVHFDDQLFSRTARGMQPTPRGQELYPTLKQIREMLDAARTNANAFAPERSKRAFRICMTDISEIVLLPPLMNHLKGVAPGVTIEVEKISIESPVRLEDGLVDLAVGFMPQLDAGFYQQVLFSQNFVCIAGKAHPRIGSHLTKKDFQRESHVVASTSGTGHAIVDKILARSNVRRHVALGVTSFLSVARIVGETELIATVPSHFAEVMRTREPITIFQMPHALPHYDVKQHWHERFHTDQGNVWLRRTVSEVMKAGKWLKPDTMPVGFP